MGLLNVMLSLAFVMSYHSFLIKKKHVLNNQIVKIRYSCIFLVKNDCLTLCSLLHLIIRVRETRFEVHATVVTLTVISHGQCLQFPQSPVFPYSNPSRVTNAECTVVRCADASTSEMFMKKCEQDTV